MRLLWTLAALAVVGGCAKVNPSASFEGVRELAASRGVEQIYWDSGTEADRTVAESIAKMLAEDLTAAEAVQVALLNNRHLQAEYETLRIAQADIVDAGLLKNPVFDGSIRFVESGGGEILDLGIALDFLDVLFIPMRKAVAAAEMDAAKLRVTLAVMDLAGETRAVYVQLQAAQQVLELQQTALAAQDASYELARRLREAGNTTALHLAGEQAAFEEARLVVTSSEESVASLRQRLNELMGVSGKLAAWTVTARLADATDELPTVEALEELALARSLDLQLARAEVEVAARRAGIARPEALLQHLQLGATAEREADGEWSVGPSVELLVPIFSQGQAGAARAEAQLRMSMRRYEAKSVELAAAVRAAHARALSARQQAQQIYTVILPLRQTIVAETLKEYNAMLVGAFQLFEAKRQLVFAGRQYVLALRDYWVARGDLELLSHGRLMRVFDSVADNDNAAPNARGANGDH